MRRVPLVAAGAVLLATGATLGSASAAGSATSVTVPAAGNTVTKTWSGTIPTGSDPTSDCSTLGDSLADTHQVRVTAPSGGYGTLASTFTFSIHWTPAAVEDTADEILELQAPDGSTIGTSDTSDTTEKLVVHNLPSGTYTVAACGYANAAAQDYTGTVSVTTAKRAAASVPSLGSTVNDSLETFTPATVVDPILFGGEPGITFDPTTSGSREFVDWPVSSRTNIGVLFRSTDGGLSFQKRYADVTNLNQTDELGVACAGRQVPYCASGGGGDTDTQIDPVNGHLYFSSQESLANEATGTSFNHGTTFPATHVDPVTHKAGGDVDRQWLGFWKGTDTVFLTYHSPIVGAFVLRNDHAGATGQWYLPSSGTATPVGTPSIPFVAQTGAMEVDNTGGRHNHTLYVAYITSTPNSSSLLDEHFAVAVSTDGAKTWTSHAVPGGTSPRNFTKIFLDTKGNLYAVWTDSSTNATYLATSKADVGANRTAPGSVWKGPFRISTAPANVTIFPDVRAGSPGRIAAIYYGTKADAATPDDVKPGQGGWKPYVAISLNALCSWSSSPCKSPAFHQMPVSHKISHNDNICTSGTACAATMGNRNLADYWDVDLDRHGHLGFVWGDTVNGIGYPYVKVARQASGPSLYAGKAAANLPMRGNGYPDPSGDARYPTAGAQILHASNHPTLDLRGTTVQLVGSKLELVVRLSSARGLGAAVPTGTDGLTPLQQAKYVVRWDYNGQVYYAGANVPAGGKPAYFSGKVSTAEGITSLTNPDNLQGFGNVYSPLTSASGRIVGNALVIDVPRSAVGSPKAGAQLQSVGSYSMVGPQDSLVTLTTLPVTVDSAPTFDTHVKAVAAAYGSRVGDGDRVPSTGAAGGSGGTGSLAETGMSSGLAAAGVALMALGLLGRRRNRPRTR